LFPPKQPIAVVSDNPSRGDKEIDQIHFTPLKKERQDSINHRANRAEGIGEGDAPGSGKNKRANLPGLPGPAMPYRFRVQNV